MTDRRPFLTAEWRHLLIASGEVDPALLAPHVPAGTELDSWEGRTFVSLVALRFRDTRVLGVPVPLHRDFEELNLRFYVRRGNGPEPRRGAVFLREVVPRRAIAAVARALYHEPYTTLPMRSDVRPGPPPAVRYAWRIGKKWQGCLATGDGPGAMAAPGTLEAFITEHYWGYTRQPDGGTIEYQVAHPRWTLWRVSDFRLQADLGALFGPAFAAALAAPASVVIADGSPVSVFWPRRLPR